MMLDSNDLSKLKISEEFRSTKTIPSLNLAKLSTKFLICVAFFILAAITYTFINQPVVDVSSSTESVNPLASKTATLSATGYVVAQRFAAVASKAAGRLKELRVREGDAVKQGDILGVLENDDLIATVNEQQALLNVLEAEILVARADLRDAELHHKRLWDMQKTRSVSQQELDSAVIQLDRNRAKLHATQATFEARKAALERAKVELSYTYIVAPFSGTVLSKNADVGEVVSPFGSSNNARAAIVSVADMNSLEVEADVSEAHIEKIYVGQQCEIILDSQPNKIYRGKVHRIVPTVDRSKATVLTKISFDEDTSRVLPEMSAKVTFDLSEGS